MFGEPNDKRTKKKRKRSSDNSTIIGDENTLHDPTTVPKKDLIIDPIVGDETPGTN